MLFGDFDDVDDVEALPGRGTVTGVTFCDGLLDEVTCAVRLSPEHDKKA